MRTKLFCILILLTFFLAIKGNAQRKTYIGIKGGYNASNANFFHSFNGSDIKTDFESGMQVGIVAMNFLRNHVGVQVELNYAQKGWQQKFSNGQANFVTELDYVELPMLVNIYTGKNKNHFFANAGCFFEYLVNVKQSALPTDTEGEEFYPFDEHRDNNFGYGFRGGVGYFRDFSFGTIMFESSFSYSLSNMLETGGLDTGIPNTSNNMVIGATIAYMFSFGSLAE